MTIVIIDDDEAILDVTSMLFEKEEWIVHSYLSFPGFDEIASLKPDVLLLDYWMEGLAGKELLAALEQHEQLRHVPRLVMSAMQKIEDQLAGHSVAGVIKKPFDIDELLSTAQTVARKHKNSFAEKS